jgi:hypothetical protein
VVAGRSGSQRRRSSGRGSTSEIPDPRAPALKPPIVGEQRLDVRQLTARVPRPTPCDRVSALKWIQTRG